MVGPRSTNFGHHLEIDEGITSSSVMLEVEVVEGQTRATKPAADRLVDPNHASFLCLMRCGCFSDILRHEDAMEKRAPGCGRCECVVLLGLLPTRLTAAPA